MKNTLKTKLIGSAVFVVTVCGALAGTYSLAQAQFISSGNTVAINGTVSSINAFERIVTITTVDSSPLTFQVTSNTKFGPSGTNNLGDVSVGDSVIIKGTQINGRSHQYVATSLQENGGVGYGHNNNRLRVASGVVTDVNTSDSNFTILFGTTYVNFEVHSTTNFIGTTYAKLKVGNTVSVTGEDEGTYFLADKVTLVSK